MPHRWSSVDIGIWVENGSRYETSRRERRLPLHRASAVQGHATSAPPRRSPRNRRGRRRAQCLHRQGIHLLLRQGARRRPDDGDRTARRHLSRVGLRPGRDRSRAPGRVAGNLAGRRYSRRFHPRPLQPELLAGPSAGVADFRLGRDRQRDRSRTAGLVHGRALSRGPRFHRGGRAWSITTSWSPIAQRLFGAVAGDGRGEPITPPLDRTRGLQP